MPPPTLAGLKTAPGSSGGLELGRPTLGWWLCGLALASGLWQQQVGHSLSMALRSVQASSSAFSPARRAPADDRSRASPASVKSAVVYNFIKYTTWPEQAFAGPEAPLLIVVVGPDPFGSALEAALVGKRLHGRELRVLRRAELPEPPEGHLLFLGALPQAAIDAAIARTRGLAILTVSESADFARRGGCVRLFEKQGKPRFEINIDRQAETGLSLDVELLKLAEIYTDRGRRAPGQAFTARPSETGELQR